MALLKKIFKVFGKKDRKRFIILFFLMLFSACLEVIGIGSVPVVIRYILEPEKIAELPSIFQFLQKNDLLSTSSLFMVGSCLIIFVFLFKNLYKIFVEYNQLNLVKDVQIKLATKLFRKYLFSPYSFYLQRNTSILIRNIQNEVSYITTKVLIPVFVILLNAVIIIGIFTSMVVIEPVLTVLVVSILIVSMGSFNLIVRKRLRAYGKLLQKERRKQLQYLYQGLQGFKTAKVANKENFFVKLFENSTIRFSNAQLKANTIGKLPPSYLEVVAIVVILLLVGGMMSMGYEGNQLTYLLSFFGLALIRMRQNFSTSMVNLNLIRTNEVSFDPVIKDMDIINDREEDSNGTEIGLTKSIAFDRVSFHYQDSEEYVIDDLSLTINKGEVIGVAGTTGSGKTTLIDLMLGLHKPVTGSISVDGVNIKSGLSSWQKHIGYVPQGIYLLDDSIMANIAFGVDDSEIDKEQVNKVIKAAQLENYINSLPDGILTQAGENGVKLSGGQRQRIGIARALYHNPNVLILDEATSALDNKTEKEFVDILYQLGQEITIVMIAHRLSTLERCSRILFMKKGKIAEEGDFLELMYNRKDFALMAANA